MKINKLIILTFLSLLMISCEDETDIYNKKDPQLSVVSFIKRIDVFSVITGNNIYKLKVGTTKIFETDQTFEVVLNSETTGNVSQYSMESTSITIPAGKLSGFTNIDFNFDVLIPGAAEILVFDLIVPDGIGQNVSLQKTTVKYSRPCNFNLLTLDITFDDYSEETSWDVKDSNDTIVYSNNYVAGIGQTSELVCLPSGNYIFTIYDVYDDGICCTYGDGSYTLYDNSNTYASGDAFGQFESTSFTIN